MGRVIRDAQVTTKNARSKLPAGLHWRALETGSDAVHLGYRRAAKGGSWIVRWRAGTGYSQAKIGTADDVMTADGAAALSYEQAVAAAKRAVIAAREQAAAEAAGPILTVASAVREYVEYRERSERAMNATLAIKADARSRLARYVLSATIAEIPLHALTKTALREWQEGLPSKLAPATKKRTLTDLKAALNKAVARHEHLPAGLAKAIKDGLVAVTPAPTVARQQVLPDHEVRALVAAAKVVDERDGWAGDLHRLMLLLAATGARFSQVARMRVGDVQVGNSRLMIPVSRKGKGLKGTSHVAVPVAADVIAALRPAIAGRRSDEPLLVRWRHKQIGPMQWARTERGPWTSASELTRPWSLIVAEAGLPGTVAYAFRHSSIVRGLRSGLPTRLVAGLHDTSTMMIEQHYSAYIVSALDELAARAVVPLDEPMAPRVVAIGGRA